MEKRGKSSTNENKRKLIGMVCAEESVTIRVSLFHTRPPRLDPRVAPGYTNGINPVPTKEII